MGNVGASLIGPLKGNMPYINIPLAPFKGGIKGASPLQRGNYGGQRGNLSMQIKGWRGS